MKISLNWIKEFTSIPADITPQEFARLFTLRTAEIEQVEDQAGMFENMVIGRIESIKPHPDADKLRVTATNVGKETLQIVCGAPNIQEGMLVPVALIGAKVRWHGEGDLIALEKAKIRGVESSGMICAGEEIGLPASPEGIVDLTQTGAAPGTSLAAALGKNDVILTLDNKSITHRPDLWGHYGLAREAAAIFKQKLKPLPKEMQIMQGSKEIFAADVAGRSISVSVKTPKLCPRYTGIQIDNVTVEPSPMWLQNRLTALGYRPINNIVDATNAVMAELGQPLHAFDTAKIENGIVVRKAKSNETVTTLDGVERQLSKNDLVIADHKKVLAIAGVMGAESSEISPGTTSIFLESATFNPAAVRKTSTRLNLRTEAVQRFEKSLDPHLAGLALNRVCELILQLCPQAKIASKPADVRNFDEKEKTVKLKLKSVSSKIGVPIDAKTATDILTRLEFTVKETSKGTLSVTIPTFRATKDVSMEEDLTEEIARFYGYENIPAQLPQLPIQLPHENSDRQLKHFTREILSYGLGFTEVYNYSFYSQKDIQKTLLPPELHITLNNYLSQDQTHMRVSLVPLLLKNIAHNLKYFPEFSLYEIGRTYEDLQEYFPLEQKKICGFMVRSKKGKSGASGNAPASASAAASTDWQKSLFYQAKGALETLLAQFQTAGIEMRKGEALCPYAHPNRYAGYFLKKDGKELARVFELHPLVAKNYDLENTEIAGFEVNFNLLATLGKRERKYRPLPKFQSVELDIAILIPKNTVVETVAKALRAADKTLIQSVELFDLYEGQNIAEDKKSVAFKVTLRATDHTLTDEEIKAVQQAMFAALTPLGGQVRSG